MYHRKLLLTTALVAGVGLGSQVANAAPSAPFTQCPSFGNSSSCSILFQFTTAGVSSFFDSSISAYDGSDDVLVGVLNSSSSTVNSLSLTGFGNGGGIFGFDGDGIQNYGASVTGTTFPSGYSVTGYEGPNTYFSNITTSGTTGYANDTGVVNFIGGLAAGDSLYFSLEGSPDSIQSGGGITAGPTVPEPSSLGILGLGLAVLGGLAMRRKAQG